MTDTNIDFTNRSILGERLCLDFVNTVGWRLREKPSEWLFTYEDLIAWSTHVGIQTHEKAQELLQRAAEKQKEAEKVFQAAINVRETLYRIFTSIMTSKDIGQNDIAELSKWIHRANSFILLEAEGTTFTLVFQDSQELDQMLWPIIQSAQNLLLSDEKNRLKRCEGDMCGWLFMDTSKNGSRRWCSMADCGNRAKAKRHYRKKKENS